MKTPVRLAFRLAGLGLLGFLASAGHARAAEVTVLCSNGLKAVMDELVPQFERATGHTVAIRFDLAAGLQREIEAGAAFDLAILTPPPADDLIGQGRLVAGSRTAIARSGLGIAIRAGARKPDIGTVDAFRRTLVEARSIALAREGASGVAFTALIEKMGLADTLRSKLQLTGGAEEVGDRVVRGEAELGILPVSEILPVRGAELLGTFPADVQSYIEMIGGVSARARQADAARELLRFLTVPAAVPVITAKGMEPG
jgi:molybdate transport system substrate-binding protein